VVSLNSMLAWRVGVNVFSTHTVGKECRRAEDPQSYSLCVLMPEPVCASARSVNI
jgi:hypothetical protein